MMISSSTILGGGSFASCNQMHHADALVYSGLATTLSKISTGRLAICCRTLDGCLYRRSQWAARKKQKDEISQGARRGNCRAALPDDAPFALAIGASILSTLVLPVSAEQDDKKDESVFGTDDVLAGAMQIISFIPLFNWLVWVLAWLDTRQPRYLAFSAIYLAPYLKTGLSLSPEESWLPIASILACIVHVQLDISVNAAGQSPLGDVSKVLLEKAQIKDLAARTDGLGNRLKEVTEKSDLRPVDMAIQEDEQRKGAEWKAIQEEARQKEFAEWDEKLSRSKIGEEAAKEIES